MSLDRPPPHFIAAWREHRGWTQEQLAEEIEMTTASVSRVENYKQPYNQRMLEKIASALHVSTADLLIYDPRQPVPVPDIWYEANEHERRQIIAFGETIVKFRHEEPE